MCSRSLTSAWQWVHFVWISRVGMFDQYSPILWVLCSALKMNCHMFFGKSLFLLPCHMLSSVSRLPVMFCIVYLVISRLFVVAHLAVVFFCYLIPLYANAWVMVANFTPCRLNSLGTVRSMGSLVVLSAPSFVRWSAWSFPYRPLCPFTHMKPV
ncbi:uncharacterized protein BJ212DRAFT_1534546 [Suillus subaureus]|uniref:Uncharacterized protein n=1 Tax=Suillus subaureus TaxID=48587 RepID=A0A9P7J849_9AGAM|nr:uncharacterized protein BJ212DRAFT_1534546 [Suillus subaureus]KAG1808024.1 hypothetical protein BJ212DRAFT_1534546 [Suillus subaureus]